jgi:signal transduction histidine kinase
LPSAWLERLLDTVSELAGERDTALAVHRLLETAVELLPEMSFAVRLSEGRGNEEEPLIVVRPRRPRSGRATQAARSGPTWEGRVFPDIPFERVLPLDLPDGGALHLGCHDSAALTSGRVPLFAARLSSTIVLLIRAARGAKEEPRHPEAETTQAALIETEKLAGVGQLAAGIVHEMNNALTVIFGYADHLRRKAEKSGWDGKDTEKLGRIAETSERLQRFSRALIEYARPHTRNSGAAGIATASIDDAVDKALSFCAPLLEDGGVTVERRLDPGSPVVRGLEAELVHIFVNLITNACHAMQPNGGTLTIETAVSSPSSEVSISVSDSGHGISRADVRRIFEPFFTTKPQGRGTGLGLSVVRMLVERHAGTVAVESREGIGTRFVIHLPLQDG